MENTPSKVIKSVVNGVVVQRILPNTAILEKIQTLGIEIAKINRDGKALMLKMKLERLQQNAEARKAEAQASRLRQMRTKYNRISNQNRMKLYKQLGMDEWHKLMKEIDENRITHDEWQIKVMEHQAKYIVNHSELIGADVHINPFE